MSKQNLLLIHVHYIKVDLLSFKSLGFFVQNAPNFEKEPITEAFRVCVWLQVQIVLVGLNLDDQIQIATFKHRLKSDITRITTIIVN